ncbi:MAG: hypothetical protein FJ276_33640 [Planctomycetes bacterium]|nr:hypothetical protein [Planctomycetota bacterium]
MVSEYVVPWVASENEADRDLALKWIDAKRDHIASGGWNSYAAIVAITADDALDVKELESLLNRIVASIHEAPNRVRYVMDNFVIAVGTYVKPLTAKAKAAARKIGPVQVDAAGTSCKAPDAISSIEKNESKGLIGKKRKATRC